MNILFVRNYPSVDGVFTLLLRLGDKFKQDGHKMFYIDFGVKTDFETEIAETFTVLTSENLTAGKELQHIDVMFPFADGNLSYWCIKELKNRHVYHPKAYYVSTHLGPSPDTRIYRKLFSKMPSENIVFMNEIVKKKYKNYLKLPFSKSPIIPLPIKLESKLRDFKQVNRKKIVSVGRLENSKRYVIAMMEVMIQLFDEGNDYKFYIYGHGQLKEFMIDYIQLNNAGCYIFFLGELEYKNLFSVLKDAFMFIGMGTVLIEGSFMGIPALQAIDSEKEHVTHWFFVNLKGLTIGEVNDDFLKIGIGASIEDLAEKNEEEYHEFALAHIKRANIFNIDEVIKQYYDFINNASGVLDIKLPSYKLYFVKILREFYKLKAITKIEHTNMSLI